MVWIGEAWGQNSETFFGFLNLEIVLLEERLVPDQDFGSRRVATKVYGHCLEERHCPAGRHEEKPCLYWVFGTGTCVAKARECSRISSVAVQCHVDPPSLNTFRRAVGKYRSTARNPLKQSLAGLFSRRVHGRRISFLFF